MEQENDEILVKITEVCRACLSQTNNMKCLLETSEETLRLLSKFASVANLQIEVGCKYPSYLCHICEEKIINSYEFQLQCHKSNDLVKEYMAVFEKQETPLVEPGLEIISQDVNLTQIQQNSMESLDPPYDSNVHITTELDEEFQKELKNEISSLKQKSKHKKDFTCKFCELQFSSCKKILEHLYSHQASNKNSPVTSKTLQENDTHIISCKLCHKIFLTNKKLQNHKCTRGKRKKNKNLIEEIETEGDILKIEGEESEIMAKEESNSKCSALEKCNNFTAKEVPLKNKAQRMRLKQYSIKDVEKAINIVREKIYRRATCIFCSFTAITNRSLSVHVTRVHREKKGKWCSSCNQVIENRTSHNKEVHYEDLKCPFCNKIKSNMGHFMEHLASHSAERLHKCDICYKSFIAPRHLRIHKEKTHANEHPFKCNICKKIFLKEKLLKLHIKTDHSSQQSLNDTESKSVEGSINVAKEETNKNDEDGKLYCNSDSAKEVEDKSSKSQNFCKECNRQVKNFSSHYSKHHDKIQSAYIEKQNLCPHCGKRFKTKSKMNVHIRTHTGEAPYKCQYCDKRFKTRNVLVVHQRTHTGEKPYSCTVCGKCFAQSSMLNTHMRIHTGRPEQCTICEKRFCRPAELKLHMRKHTGEKPYICDQCGQGFKQKSHLVEHTKTHTEDRPFKCEYCGKAFKSSGTLKCHIQIHTGQKPFKCSQCSYACRQPYSLTQHMAQHTNDKPQPDYPHKCQLCERNFATVAHLTTHHNRYHSNIKIIQAIPENEMVISDYPEADQNNQDIIYDVSQDDAGQVQTVETVENVDRMIITEIADADDIKFEPIQIQITRL